MYSYMMKIFYLCIFAFGAANLYMIISHLLPTITMKKKFRPEKKNNIVVLPVKDRVNLTRETIKSLDNQSNPFDLIMVYVDYDSSNDMLNFLNRLNTKTPLRIRHVPSYDKWSYQTYFRKGKLRTIWWWLMNNAWNTVNPEYMCYFEDDIIAHPDFFKWVLQHKTENDNIWGLFGTSGAMYTPLCVSKNEWSFLRPILFKPKHGMGHGTVSITQLWSFTKKTFTSIRFNCKTHRIRCKYVRKTKSHY